MPPIAAVVATHNRSALLANRSLPSIARQTRPPEYVVAVDDSDADVRLAKREVVSDFRASGVNVIYIENTRAPGASGAWNAALSELQRIAPSAFVAILDDDDAWAPDYLRLCERAALDRDLDMVVAGIVRYESADYGQPTSIPDRLDADDFLVGNPNVQGSNLFVRLRKLLEAGAFDEELASSTDRDLCIRLADLGTVRFGSLARHLVHHYADFDRPRLSIPGGDAKRAGLRYFYRKYRSRMTDSQRAAFVERSLRLFGCDPRITDRVPKPALPTTPINTDAAESPAVDDEPLDLVVGAITSPDVGIVGNLMDSLIRNLGNRRGVTLKLILLENGRHDSHSRRELAEAVESASIRELDVDMITLERQRSDVDSGAFQSVGERMSARKSIALSRTMLQRYLFLEAKPRHGAVVWILDDDAILEGLAYAADGSVQVVDVDYASAIKRLKDTGNCIVLGEVTGDPPLPFLSSVRVQLVDLYHNLRQLESLNIEDSYPSRSDENRLSRLERRDYYYDLSRAETDRLESPFWYEPSDSRATVAEVFEEIVSRLVSMLSGSQVFRPLAQPLCADPLSELVPSVNRGPSTLVFDLHAMREFPNVVPEIDGKDTRRSDMVWSLLARFAGGCRIVKSPLLVRQVRTGDGGDAPDFDTLYQDIRGFAFSAALQEVFSARARRREREGRQPYGRDFLYLDDDEIRHATALYIKYARERSLAFELSFIRCAGIVAALRPLCDVDAAGDAPAWWLESADYQEPVAALRDFVNRLASIYTDARLDEFRRSFSDINTAPIERFLRNLPTTVSEHRANTPLPEDALGKAAAEYVRSEFETGPLTTLGVGDEGVVLTDGKLAYKYFHYMKNRDREGQIERMRSLVGKLSGYKTLLDIREIRVDGDRVVAVYPYVSGGKYEGGHLDEMLTFLRECRDAGLDCRNIHLDNLLVTSSGLKLIDYGSDTVLNPDLDIEHMRRRAFLSYRFHYRSDLKRLMTRSLTDAEMPERIGLDHFEHALDPRHIDDLYYRPLTRIVMDSQPDTALDYGCGKGWISEELARQGVAVTAYDPDEGMPDRWRRYDGAVRYGGSDLLEELRSENATFDAIVCSRVLCVIEDDSELDDVLRDLRRMISDGGSVFVSVCNPFYATVASTELAEKILPDDWDYRKTSRYAKLLAPDGERFSDVHRSFETYVRAFSKAGLRIERTLELDGTDTRYLRPASDTLVFQLSAAPTDRPPVSLLIKTCLMEWRIIERLVRHQVKQLEHPGGFAEKVVVVDPFEGPFLRQYENSNAEAHHAAMERLLADGVVDRVIYAPSDSETVRATYRRWFGASSDETHSTNGQQLFATIYGFEACTGDYVLQLDSDMLIRRMDPSHDYLREILDVFTNDPNALFVPISISNPASLPYTFEGPTGDWRVEARGCLFDRRRLKSVLPIPNELDNDRALPWHRAFDRYISSTDYHSYRGGDPRTATIHVPNDRKADSGALFEIIDAVERGYIPPVQVGSVEMAGSGADWAGPKRCERFVFVICGRNVDPGRFRRCFDSLIAQRGADWGAVIVDDASTNGFGDYAEMLIANYRDRITLVRNAKRRGALYNTWNAVTRICANPESVIITLDADDALIGVNVLERVRAEYDDGADLTAGSMIRLDKEANYPVKFHAPRSWDSNVWQHLRTFKKYLFDAISVEDLKLDGEWIDLANDWAFMVPMVEMASDPRRIPDNLYLYEPSDQRPTYDRCERDSIIARILAKPKYHTLKR